MALAALRAFWQRSTQVTKTLVLAGALALGYSTIRGASHAGNDLGYLARGIGHVLWHGVSGKSKEPAQDSALEKKVKESESGIVKEHESGVVIREPTPPVPEMGTFHYEWGSGRAIELRVPKPAIGPMKNLRAIWPSCQGDKLAKQGFLLMDILDGHPDSIVQQENVEKVLAAFYSESLQPYGGADEIKRLYDKAQAELSKLPVK